ncbi:MAG: zinc-dependent alcohol dehydrogenase [Solirubrobacteraceae bacterium]
MTETVGEVALRDRDEPAEPGAGELLLTPAAVGICGSDYHFFLGELSDEAGGSQFPRVLGHEVGARIAALGSGCRGELAVGQLVALWPLIACGQCYPCRVGRPNTCDNFQLIGIHLDGGLQQQLIVGQQQVFPIAVADPRVAALVEPLSVAVQAVRRAAVQTGERVVVFGAGPIGQCIALAGREYGAQVLVIDREPSRLPAAAKLGADTLAWTDATATLAAAREWSGADAPAVVFDATGAAPAVRAMLELVASAGRAVQVGMSNQEVSLRIGLLTEKELDLLGVSCCDSAGFAEAVRIAERNAEALARMVSHEFPLERFPEALRFAIDNPTEVLKVVIVDE